MNKLAYLALATAPAVALAQPVTTFDFGPVNGMATHTGTIAPNQVLWFSIQLDGDETYLDISSNDFLIFSGDFEDTEIGIYDAAGNRIATDDDDGFGLRSTLSFGTGTGLELGDPFNLGGDGIANGEDGPMPGAGTYYIALGEFNVNFGASNFDVTSDGTDTGGTYVLSVYAFAVPAPGTAALLGSAGLVALRRRR